MIYTVFFRIFALEKSRNLSIRTKMSTFKLSNNLRWRDFLIRAALVIMAVTVIVIVLPRDNGTNIKIEKDRHWRYADFTAPFDFPIYKSDELVKAERDSLLRLYDP